MPPDAIAAFRQWQEQSRLLESLGLTFVVGPPKCGTTWVMRTLAAHPNAVASGESHLLTKLAPPLIGALDQYQRLQTQQDRQAGTTRDRRWFDDFDRYALLRQACDRVLIGYLKRAADRGKTRVGAIIDKTPGHARHVATLAQLYPWARVLCVVRDVRDAAVSAWHYFSRIGSDLLAPATTIEQGAEVYAVKHWAELLRHARAAGAALGPRYSELHYEQYKESPFDTARDLLAFCGLSNDEDTVAACVASADFRTVSGREPGQEAPEFCRKGVVGDWRNHFSDDIALRIERLAGQRLAEPVGAAA